MTTINYKIDENLIKVKNAISCKGCGKGMDLLLVGTYHCNNCGGVSTGYGGWWSYKDMNIITENKNN